MARAVRGSEEEANVLGTGKPSFPKPSKLNILAGDTAFPLRIPCSMSLQVNLTPPMLYEVESNHFSLSSVDVAGPTATRACTTRALYTLIRMTSSPLLIETATQRVVHSAAQQWHQQKVEMLDLL